MKKLFFATAALCTLIACSCSSIRNVAQRNFERESDFQIHDDYFETKPSILKKISSIDDMINQKFLSAVKRFDHIEVERMLREEKRLSARTCDNLRQTALMWACWYGDLSMVKLLLQPPELKNKRQKIDAKTINAKSVKNYTALFCAAYRGSDSIMKLLLDNGARLSADITDINGENVLHKMAKSGRANTMSLVLQDAHYGIFSPRYRSQWQKMFDMQAANGYTPFHYAVSCNDSEMVSLLLDTETKLFADKESPRTSIVNVPAKLGKQNAYPLYTAYKVRNIKIFEKLLSEPKLNLNIYFPDGNAAHEENDIADKYKLMTADSKVKPGYIFEQTRIDTSTFKTLAYPASDYKEMFDKRAAWENNGRKGKLTVNLSKYDTYRAQIISLIENCAMEKDGGQLSFEKVQSELKKLKRNLYGDICGIGYEDKKDLLRIAVQNAHWSVTQKIKILDWLLDGGHGYRSMNADEDILWFCLHSATKEHLHIAAYLIKNKSRYGDSYSFTRFGYEAYFALMSKSVQALFADKTAPIRYENKEGIDLLTSLLDAVKAEYNFKLEEVDKNIFYAVLGESVNGNKGKRNAGDFAAYARELFLYFKEQYSYDIKISDTPLCTWCYRIGFYDGVDIILNDTAIAQNLRVKESFDEHKKRFENYLISDANTQDAILATRIKTWKTLYEELSKKQSSEESPEKNKIHHWLNQTFLSKKP